MGMIILTFCSIFLVIAAGGLLLGAPKAKPRKITAVIRLPEVEKPAGMRNSFQQASASLAGIVGHFENVLPKSEAEVSILKHRLISAGYRKDAAVQIFYGAKFLLIVFLVVISLATGLASLNYFFVLIADLAIGFMGPDFWLESQIKKRHKQIRKSLPDVLDLMVICVEAGLSMDQATARTSQEVNKGSEAISDELSVVVLEQRAGCPRTDAWKHMADRCSEESIRNLVSVLVQAEQFGTSVAKTLRVHSDILRNKRVQAVEEMAAKTTIKILFPLVVFIFPVLFLVTIGPAMILMIESFQSATVH
jgi:tight adherence protein C